MSIRILHTPSHEAQAVATGHKTKAEEDAAKVGRDFEAILVRQMLASTKVAGKGGGYADMAVEALASSITAAGGLGMGHAIEQALSAAHTHAQPMKEKTSSPPQVPARPAVPRNG
jgi:Rod binding domain-containing protein